MKFLDLLGLTEFFNNLKTYFAPLIHKHSKADIEDLVEVQADWNQNDPNHPDYIKNRPFYKVKDSYTTESRVTVLEEVTIDTSEEHYIPTLVPLEIGKSYTVTWDGVEYISAPAAEYDSGYGFFGNTAIYEYDNGIETDTGEPFVIEWSIDGGDLWAYTSSENQGIHTVKIEEVTTIVVPDEVVKLDQKFVHNADWNQNDPNGEGYIKNRTHWKEENTEYILSETTVDCTSSTSPSEPFSVVLELDKTYTVTFNGIEYKCVCYDEEAYCVGNASIMNSKLEDTGEPFFVAYFYSNGDTYFQVKEVGTHIISISTEPDFTYHKIPLEYLPEMGYAGKDVTGQSFDIDGNIVEASTNAEIFNDYEGNIATGEYSHAEGNITQATNFASHAEGYSACATGYIAHAEGESSISSGWASHAEGYQTQATEQGAHSEGDRTVSSGVGSHAEGVKTQATAQNAHAEGRHAIASAMSSHAEGDYTKASSKYQHVQGRFNIEDTANKYAHIVGNGTKEAARSNAHTLDWDGNAWFAGDVYTGGTSQDDAKKLATEEYVLSEVGSANQYTDEAIANLVGTAPETLDTIQELATAMQENDDVVTALNDAITTKADKTDIVQADWNQNDESQNDYIKGRTHWVEEGIVEILPETDYTYYSSPADIPTNHIPVAFEIILGKTYIVSFDGAEYTCVAFYEENTSSNCIGNINIVMGNDVTSEELQFFAFSRSDGSYGIVFLEGGQHWFGIKVIDTVVTQLDEKFIPSSISRTSEVASTYIKDLSSSGSTLTFTKGDDTTSTIEIETAKVSFGVEQELTDTEKDTARTNIGMNETADVKFNSIAVNYLTMKDKITGFDYFITIENGVIVYSSKLVSIEVTKAPDIVEYYKGDSLDSNMIVTATYEDGKTSVITDYTYSDLVAGNTSVEISYTENGITCTTTLEGLTIKSVEELLIDFTYTANADGTYTITDWKGTYNGVESTELHVPNSSRIIV